MKSSCPPASTADEQAWNEQQLAEPLAQPAWRVWRYAHPAVVLGCSQRRLFESLAARPPAGAGELLLRRAGGGAVLVGPWMVGVSAALPPDHTLVRSGPVGSYRWLGEGLARVLQHFGVAARALSPEELPRRAAAPSGPDLRWACFAGLSPWEAVAGGRKITGLAQVRRRTGVLLVAGVLVRRPDWALLCAALDRPAAEAEALARATTCCADEGAAGLAPETLARAVDAEIARLLAPPAGAGTASP